MRSISKSFVGSSGLDWNENLPYTDPKNSEIAMDLSADPIQYVLSQPIVCPQKVSGKPIEE